MYPSTGHPPSLLISFDGNDGYQKNSYDATGDEARDHIRGDRLFGASTPLMPFDVDEASVGGCGGIPEAVLAGGAAQLGFGVDERDNLSMRPSFINADETKVDVILFAGVTEIRV